MERNGKRKQSEAELGNPSYRCLILCHDLQTSVNPRIDLASVTTPDESLRVETTLAECNRIESLLIESSVKKPVFWECLRNFLEHAVLKEVILLVLLPGGLLSALAHNRRTTKVCLFFKCQQPTAALANFLEDVHCEELELRIRTTAASTGLRSLGAVLQRNPFVRQLSIIDTNALQPEPLAAVFFQSLPRQLEKLFSLSITSSKFSLKDQRRIIEAIRELPYLKTLDLRCHGMLENMEEEFLRYLRTTKVLECLTLNCGARSSPICEATKENPSIKHITLGVNGVSKETGQVIGTFLEQSVHVKKIHLFTDLWKSADEGITYVAKGLASSRTLCSVHFSLQLSSHQLELVFEGLKRNPGITRLEILMDSDYVGNAGKKPEVAPLCARMELNTTLKSLKLSSRAIGEKEFNSLLASVAVNNTLEEVEVTSCSSVDKPLPWAWERHETSCFSSQNRADAHNSLISSLGLNVSLLKVHGDIFQRQHRQLRGKIQRILQRNRHLADPKMGDRIPSSVWPLVLEWTVRNWTVAGRSCVFGYLRSNLKWIHQHDDEP